jgi:hypothetical protein
MFLFGLSFGIAAAFVLLMVCLTIFTGRENKRPQWHIEYERKNDIYMTQMVSTWKKISATLENWEDGGVYQEIMNSHYWPSMESAPSASSNNVRKAIAPLPTIVCLCGSTRFSEAFREANLEETLAGKIVLSIGCDFKSDQGLGLTDTDKEKLDLLHLRKIDLADEVLILNVGGYIGKSTRKELDYALTNNKRVRYLEALQLP